MNEADLCDLPSSWVWATLEEIVTHSKGKKPKNLFSTGGENRLPYIDIKAFEHGVVRKFAMLGDGVECWEKDILLVWDGARSGLVGTHQKGIVGSTIMRLSSLGPESEYLFRFLQMKYNELNSNTRGTGIPHLDPKYIWTLPLPLAPLNEQKRIVAKVESLLEENRTVKRALDEILSLMAIFRKLILAKAFRGELIEQDTNDEPAEELLERIRRERRKKWEEDLRVRGKDSRKHKYKEPEPLDTKNLPESPASWTWTNIGTISIFIGSGITPRGGKKIYVKDGIPFIRSQNVYPDGLHLENVAHITPELHAKMKRTHVKSGDVLLNITGASIGRCTYVPENFGPANVNQHVCIIRTGGWILPQYLSSFLNSELGQSQIFSAQSGVTREGLNYTQLRALRVPLAPIEEQERIITRIRELFLLAEEAEKTLENARKRAKAIDQSILAKAFRGKLVPQDPNDEPASTLLQRIKVDVAKMQIKAGKKKRKIRPPSTVQQTLAKPLRGIRAILKEMGQATVEQVFQASGLSMSDFWDELKIEIDAGRIEQIRKGNSVFLKVKG